MSKTGLSRHAATNSERAVRKFNSKIGVLAASAAFGLGLAGTAQAQNDLLYDWKAVNAATTPVSGFTPAPFVFNGTAASVAAQLPAFQAAYPGKVAVKIVEPLTPANIALLFNNPNFTINNAFYDLEGAGSTATAQSQAQQIHAIPKSAATRVGNFNLYPGSGDSTGPGAGPSYFDYTSGGPTGVNMANEGLYPGTGSFKNPSGVGGTSSSPNIRSTLFTLPILRASYVSAQLPAGHLHLPFVNRFNNWGNNALDTDGNPANGYAFVQNAANPSAGQLLSRGDFSAMVAHYRARGVQGLHLLDGGVVGYSQAQFEQDAKDGFKLPAFEAIFNGGGAKLATLDTVGKVDGVVKNTETSGVIFSGVYSLTQAGGAGKLALLVSNLDDAAHSLSIDQKIGGKTVPGSISILAGQHKLLDFTGAGTQWSLQNPGGTLVFTDDNRNGVGVPEPVTMGGVALFALGILGRRRVRK
jgi:hypothetical protein